MKHDTRPSIGNLLKAAHARKGETALSEQWQHSVMAHIERSQKTNGLQSEMERLAPRFTLAATTVSIIGVGFLLWSLGSIQDGMTALAINQVFEVVPSTWTSM